jgi:hypothetical protein
MFSFSKNIICVGVIAPFGSLRLAEKKKRKFSHQNAKLFSKLTP